MKKSKLLLLLAFPFLLIGCGENKVPLLKEVKYYDSKDVNYGVKTYTYSKDGKLHDFVEEYLFLTLSKSAPLCNSLYALSLSDTVEDQ